MSFAAPQAPVSRWRVTVNEPGVRVNIEPFIAATSEPQADEAQQTIVLAFVGAAQTVSIAWTPRAEGATGLDALVAAQVQQRVTIDEGAVRTRADLNYAITRAERSTLLIDVPADQKVVNVVDPNVRQWSVEAAGDRQRIKVQLFEPASQTQRITVALEKFTDQNAQQHEVQVPVVRAEGVGQQHGLIVVAVAPGLRADATVRNGVIQIDSDELPEPLAAESWTAAYRYAAVPFSLAFGVEKIQPRIVSDVLVEARLRPRDLNLSMLAVYDVQRAGVFTLELDSPAGYELRRVAGQKIANAEPVQVDSHHLKADDPTHLVVNLSRKAIGRVALAVEWHKELAAPDLIKATGRPVELELAIPRIRAGTVEHESGRLIVYAPESLRLDVARLQGARSVSFNQAMNEMASLGATEGLRPVLSFAYTPQPVLVQLAAERRKPHVSVAQRLVARIEAGVAKYEATFQYDIRYSPVETLRIDVPAELAADLRNQTPQIRHTVLDPAPDDLAGGHVAWSLGGDAELMGRVVARLSWERTIEKLDLGRSVVLPVHRLIPRNTDRAWGQIVLAKAETIDVRAADEPRGLRPIDPQHDLMGNQKVEGAASAFEFHDDWAMGIEATRYDLHEVKTTSIERALVRMVVTRSRQVSAQALYRVRSAQQRLTLQLPPGVEFDTSPLRINGQSVTLERGSGRAYFVPLVGQVADKPFLLELRYRLSDQASLMMVPAFPDDPAVQKVYLLAYLPKSWSLLGSRGPWSDEMYWVRGPTLRSVPLLNRNDNELLAWVTQDVSVQESPGQSFQTDGRPYLFSALRPAPDDSATLRLVSMSDTWLNFIAFGVVAAGGVLLLRSRAATRWFCVGAFTVALVLCGVFMPTLSRQIVSGPFVLSILVVLILWLVHHQAWVRPRDPAVRELAEARHTAKLARLQARVAPPRRLRHRHRRRSDRRPLPTNKVVSISRREAATMREIATRILSHGGLTSAGLIAVALLCGAAAPAAPNDVHAPLVAESDREIYVPFEALNLILEGDHERVLLSRQQYEQLRARAQRTPKVQAPRSALLAAAEYDIVIQGERAELEGRLEVAVLDEGLHAVPLELGGVGLRRARLGDQDAPIGRNSESGALVLFVAGAGRHQVKLEMVAPVQATAAQQTLRFSLPTAGATRLGLSVPGDVEVRSGAAVVDRRYDEASETTHMQLLADRSDVTLVMTLNSRLLRQQRVVVARSVLIDEVTASYERLHATVSMAVLHRAVDGFRFAVPNGFDVTNVSGPMLARWALDAEGDGRVLKLQLRDQTTETVVLNLSAVRTGPPPDDWSLPQLRPLDVSGQMAIVGLLLEDRLEARAIEFQGLIRIDTSTLEQALPASVFNGAAGAPRVRPVVAYYAPQGDMTLRAQFVKPPAAVNVVTSVLLNLNERQLEVRGGFSLLPEQEKLFGFDMKVPPGWDVQNVTDENDQPLAFERYGAVEGEEDGKGLGSGGARIAVKLSGSATPAREQRVYFRATHVPDGWLEQWETIQMPLPVFAVIDAATDRGAVAVAAHDDMRVRPNSIDRLSPLDENEKVKFGLPAVKTDIAYRYDGQPYAATLIVERVVPRIKARTISFLRLEPDTLSARYELAFDVAAARTRRLSLLLPRDTPAALSIKGLDGLKLKETTSEPAGESDSPLRRWTAVLEGAHQGTVRLAVDFEQPRKLDGAEKMALHIVRADGVAYQSGLICVEGHAELNVQIDEHTRAVDVGELVDAVYQPGRRLLGVWEFTGPDPKLAISVIRRPLYGLYPLIVERAHLLTRLSNTGRAQTSAHYRLRAKATFIEVGLPTGSTLWSAALDGRPIKPQRAGDRVLLNLPGGASAVRNLSVVYETPVESVLFWSTAGHEAPALMVHAEDAAAGQKLGNVVVVPVADLTWHVHPPAGYRVIGSGGTVTTDQIETPTLAAARVGRWLYDALGGVGGGGLLLGSLGRDPDYDFNYIAVDSESAGPVAAGRAAASRRMPSDKEELSRLKALGYVADQADEAAPDTPPASSGPAFSMEAAPSQQAVTLRRRDLSRRAYIGSRGVQIDLDRTGRQLVFESFGVDPRFDLTMVKQSRLDALAWGLGLAVALAGLTITHRPGGTKLAFVVAIGLIATGLPVLTGWMSSVHVLNGMFYAAALLVPYFLLAGAARWALARWRRALPVPGAVAVATLVVVVMSMSTFTALADEATQDKTAPYVIEVVEPGPPVKVPADAIILPYDPDAEDDHTGADKLLVPHDRFVELWNRAHPDRKIEADEPPVPYALAGASYTATLKGDQFVLFEGHIDLDVYADREVLIPLTLAGGVLTRAALNDGPARLSVVTERPSAEEPQQIAQQAVARQPQTRILSLRVATKGRHRLDLAVRARLGRRGGWRVAAGRLPAAAATALVLKVLQPQTEIRLGAVADQRAYLTEATNQEIHTALGIDGVLMLQWRPKVAAGLVERTLTAQSNALLDVQEDGLRLIWKLDLDFRGGETDRCTLLVPSGYLVENVEGVNVRGWETQEAGEQEQLDVTLLRPARGRETLTLHLWRHVPLGGGGEPVNIDLRGIVLPDAALHSGLLTVRRSPLLDVRTVQTRDLSRADLSGQSAELVASLAPGVQSPLGIRDYQALRFGRTPFLVQMRVEPIAPRATAVLATILRIGERRRTMESRIVLTAQPRPIYRVRVAIPGDLTLEPPEAHGPFEWSVTERDGRWVLTIHLTSGREGEIPIVLRGSLGDEAAVDSVGLPRLEVLDVARQEGHVVVQSDPAFAVVADGLVNCRTVLLSRVFGWLQPAQRALARVALHYEAPQYDGQLRITLRKADVQCFTVTNVRFTDRTIEQTILIDFAIRHAGVRGVEFLLPESMQDARISVPMLRRKTIKPAADRPGMVRVHLALQDEVLNELRVLVEDDGLVSDASHEAAIPVVLTGRTTQRYVAVENLGRDAVATDKMNDLETLSRQQKEYRTVADLFGGNTTVMYMVKEGASDPRLVLRTQQREAVMTAGARIGLAQTVLVLDTNGAYRAMQTYRLDNATEQFLEVDMPAGARLWTARVAGEPVKPALAPGAAAGRVRIPLVKTAPGDLDYEVVIKYGGQMAMPGLLRGAVFPLIRTMNVRVQLSQVRLLLPPALKWFNFDGTMRQVATGDELAADVVSYYTGQLKRMSQLVKGGDEFASVRARSNINVLQSDIKSIQRGYGIHDEGGVLLQTNERFKLELREQNDVLAQVQSEVKRNRGAPAGFVSNVLKIESRFGGQRLANARNVANDLTNFSVVIAEKPDAAPDRFDSSWFGANKLGVDNGVAKDAGGFDPTLDPYFRLGLSSFATARASESQRAELGAKLQMQVQDRPVAAPKQKSARPERQGRQARVDRYRAQLEVKDNAEKSAEIPEEPVGQDTRMARRARGPAPQAAEKDSGALAVAAPPTGLASLDVDIALRGHEVHFTTPGGDVQITARAVSTNFIDGLKRFGWTVGVLLMLALIARIIRHHAFAFDKPVAWLGLVLLGGLSIGLGILPVLGVAAVVAGVGLAIRRRLARRAALDGGVSS